MDDWLLDLWRAEHERPVPGWDYPSGSTWSSTGTSPTALRRGCACCGPAGFLTPKVDGRD